MKEIKTKIGGFRMVLTRKIDETWETALVSINENILDSIFGDNEKEAKENHQRMVEKNTSF